MSLGGEARQRGSNGAERGAAFLSAPRWMQLVHIDLQVLLPKLALDLPVLLPG